MKADPQLKRHLILKQLADGKFHSGEELGALLGISRAAVGKHMKALEALGLDVFSITGRGYRLSHPMRLLDEQEIFSHRRLPQAPPLSLLAVVDSTNSFLKGHPQLQIKGAACLAEAQTAGRGRQGRKWVSPIGASLYLSMYWAFSGGFQAIGGLSLAVGVVVAESLRDLGVRGLRLKWPNDIYLNERKLGGILIELEGQANDINHCIIGIGINVRLPEQLSKDIDQPWADLSHGVRELPDRNLLVAKLLDNLHLALEDFEQTGMKSFSQRWSDLNLYQGKQVRMLCGTQEYKGLCLGINRDGALLVELASGPKAFYGGEVSVRQG
ncbi:bifunctional biotin--[acetyl-CoA-carboxylase] ligase/biotin operon repressor BirA [Aliiglaciecola sp. CAU 1673]|uniref:bifunctional biotin--[acetyl-CoA-carboxylase] ligase/biotin operon repressor BirA n=1 Tax=Aliiglaciecola sp. CAU 1673 TaxID=3032595 RepID=UPI0023D98802|nr:bifunctional biotin--[acetyl-CoA-carboxylase] ligase/biotin operon repressor BirA [Aliiglaciecola sp. CAU 1673]MDF2178576.1 bifunctional biotin--[acetyl-CoA-carboxylase] ligase/biotin operon repressor BirA [Aliiglaciecola sp. CAU 1673]